MASDKKVWFGTRDLMQWVKAPATNVGTARRVWESGTGFLSGGYSQITSNYSALTYTMSWNVLDSETADTISGYVNKIYGDGLLYYSDPFSWSNVMPLSWSAAYLTATDAPTMIQDYRPTVSPVTVNGARFPTKAANYSLSNASVPNDIYIPIPQGHRLILAGYGSASGSARVEVRTFITGGNYATALPMLSTASTATGTGGYMEVANVRGENDFTRLYLTGVGQMSLVGVHAYILPIDGPASTSFPYYPLGKGNSGLRFEGSPQITGYSSVLDQQAMTANLVETGAWE